MYEFRWVHGGHIEVFLNGEFQFSADSPAEARRELSIALKEQQQSNRSRI